MVVLVSTVLDCIVLCGVDGLFLVIFLWKFTLPLEDSLGGKILLMLLLPPEPDLAEENAARNTLGVFLALRVTTNFFRIKLGSPLLIAGLSLFDVVVACGEVDKP